MIVGAVESPAERYFYMVMAARERWSVRELRRQIDSALFLRYMSVRRDREKCLPDDAESGVGNDTFYIDLLFFHRGNSSASADPVSAGRQLASWPRKDAGE